MKSRESFERVLRNEMATYGLSLDSGTQRRLADYFELLSRWNQRLHLVAPCSPEEFATRHVLESLTLLPYIRSGAKVIDVGSGGGLPLIPCLLARSDIEGTMIESSKKKSVFLLEAVKRLGLAERARVLSQRFEEVNLTSGDYLTCRAMEQLVEKIPELMKWKPAGCKLLIFGGDSLLNSADFERILLPKSDRRFLYIEKL